MCQVGRLEKHAPTHAVFGHLYFVGIDEDPGVSLGVGQRIFQTRIVGRIQSTRIEIADMGKQSMVERMQHPPSRHALDHIVGRQNDVVAARTGHHLSEEFFVAGEVA
jgi:hypothetical protein